MLGNEMYAISATPYGLHLLGWICASQIVLKIGRNVFTLHSAVSQYTRQMKFILCCMCHLVIGKSQEVWQSRTCLEIPCYLPRSWGAKCLTTANYILSCVFHLKTLHRVLNFSLLTPFSLKVSSKNGQITPNTVTHPWAMSLKNRP